MDVKLLAVDLDGTLLDSKGRLSNKNKIALEYAYDRGIQVVIASGRPYGSLPEDVLKVDGITYAITSNGACVYHLPTKKRICEFLLASVAVEHILNEMMNLDVTFETFINGVAYADAKYVDDPVLYGASERAIPYIRRTRNKIVDIVTFIKDNSSELDSIDIIVKDEQIKKQVQERLESVAGIYVTSSVKQLVEVSHQEAGKHKGLCFLGKLLGIESGEMVAIGNDVNDLDMMQYAACAVAVENAEKVCLEVADIIVKNNEEDGVAEAIYMLVQ